MQDVNHEYKAEVENVQMNDNYNQASLETNKNGANPRKRAGMKDKENDACYQEDPLIYQSDVAENKINCAVFSNDIGYELSNAGIKNRFKVMKFHQERQTQQGLDIFLLHI